MVHIRNVPSASSGTTNGSLVPTALAGFVPSAVKRLRTAEPGLRVLLSEVTSSTLEQRFLSGEFDVALGYRDIYALLPPGERHPLARHVIRALSDTARAVSW